MYTILFWISTSPGVRQDLFKAMLRQNIEWFDHPTNSVGALMTMLGMDASTVQNMTGQSLVGLTILSSFLLRMWEEHFAFLLRISVGVFLAGTRYVSKLRLKGLA